MKFNMNKQITVKGKSKETVKVTDKDDSKFTHLNFHMLLLWWK